MVDDGNLFVDKNLVLVLQLAIERLEKLLSSKHGTGITKTIKILALYPLISRNRDSHHSPTNLAHSRREMNAHSDFLRVVLSISSMMSFMASYTPS